MGFKVAGSPARLTTVDRFFFSSTQASAPLCRDEAPLGKVDADQTAYFGGHTAVFFLGDSFERLDVVLGKTNRYLVLLWHVPPFSPLTDSRYPAACPGRKKPALTFRDRLQPAQQLACGYAESTRDLDDGRDAQVA